MLIFRPHPYQPWLNPNCQAFIVETASGVYLGDLIYADGIWRTWDKRLETAHSSREDAAKTLPHLHQPAYARPR